MVDFEELRKSFLPRFWDTWCNEMVYPEKTDGGIGYQLKTTDDPVSLDIMLQDRFIPMKPTGILDKKGNLIYEGDIVKLSMYIEPVRWQGTYWKDLNILVEYRGQSFYPSRLKESRIVSNDYEKPELLEKDNDN